MQGGRERGVAPSGGRKERDVTVTSKTSSTFNKSHVCHRWETGRVRGREEERWERRRETGRVCGRKRGEGARGWLSLVVTPQGID